MSDTTAPTVAEFTGPTPGSPPPVPLVDRADPRSAVQLTDFRKAGKPPSDSEAFPGVTLRHLHLRSWRTRGGDLLIHVRDEEVLLPAEGSVDITIYRPGIHGEQIEVHISNETDKDEWKIRLTSVGETDRWREYGPPKRNSSRRKPRQTPSESERKAATPVRPIHDPYV